MLFTQLPRVLNYGNPVNRAAPLNSGLVAWWLSLAQATGGGRILDLNKRLNATLTNGAKPSGQRRQSGFGSYLFDGTNDYATCAGPGGSWSAFTLVGWVKPTSLGDFERFVSFNLPRLGIMANGRLTAEFSGVDRFSSVGLVTTGSWQHVGLVYSDTLRCEFWKNGTLDTSIGSPSFGSQSPGTCYIGSYNGAILFFDGVLDDWRVYNRALTANEMKLLYNASRTGYQRELNWLDRPWLVNSAAAPAGGGSAGIIGGGIGAANYVIGG